MRSLDSFMKFNAILSGPVDLVGFSDVMIRFIASGVVGVINTDCA